MYLDGSRWVPNVFSNSNKKAFYYAPTRTLQISASNSFKGEKAWFSFYINDLTGTGIYQVSYVSEFQEYPNCRDSTRYDPNDNCAIEFKVVDPNDSFIEIIEFDTIEFRVSGYFDMVLFNDSGNKIGITEGRFSLNLN
jgi:hypothetical protein